MSNTKSSRRARKQAARQNQERCTPAATMNQDHQKPQMPSPDSPLIAREPQTAIKVGNAQAAKGGDVYEDVSGIEVPKALLVATQTGTTSSWSSIIVIAYLLGLLMLMKGTAEILWGPSTTENIIPTNSPSVSGAKVSRELRPNTLLLGQSHLTSGLTILSLVYLKQLRALGMLFLCEYVAESVTLCTSLYAGVESDIGAHIAVTALRAVLGLWMICCH